MFGYNQTNDFQNQSIPLPIQIPRSKEELQRYYTRWQSLKMNLGNEASQNAEYIELQRILRDVSRRQEQARQNQGAQYSMQNQNQSATPQQQQPQVQRMPQGNGQIQQQQQQQQQQQMSPGIQSPQVSGNSSSTPQGPSGNNASGPSNRGSPFSQGPLNTPFTQDQIAMLRSQMIIFKSLTKNMPIPPQALAQVFPNQHQQLQQQQQQQQTPTPNAASAMNRVPSSGAAGGPNMPSNSPVSRQSRTPSVSSPVVQQQQQPQAAAVAAPPARPAPEPKTNAEKLGVTESIEPWTYFADEVPFDKLITRQKQLFIPSIMPSGLDVSAMKLERERQINNQMADRISQLKKFEHVKEGDDNINELVELKALRLSNYNKALKGDLLAQVYYFNSIGIDETTRQSFLRTRRPQLHEALMTEQFDQEQQRQKRLRENEDKNKHLTKLKAHCQSIGQAGRVRKQRQIRLGKTVAQYHTLTEKEEQKRIERTAKQRLQALRANDEEAYIKLLDQTKDTRITHLLKQTNEFLRSLSEAVKSQQQDSKDGGGSAVSTTGDAELDEEAENVDYYEVSHRIKEEVTKQPSILVGGTLKEYQIKGLQWMVSLYNNNLNGILADEMGLGKTIQTLSLLTYLIEVKKRPGPFLVIVPLSTLTNWNLEFEKWAPSVKKIVYKGPPPARKAQQAAIRTGDFQVLLTTYEYIIKDRSVLGRIRWIHMIIDEGHRMKNAQSKLSYTLTTFYSSQYRLILTGTPLQNNLPELWALLNFALPKIFNSVKSFDEWFNTPFANTGSQDRMDLSEEETLLIIRRLHKVLRPFLLRRLKKDVEKDLPDKVEKVIKCKMSMLQSKLYQQMLEHRMLFLGEGAQGVTNQGGVKGLNNQIMQLRKICNHPYVFEEVENLINPTRMTGDDLWRAAGKFELLDRILPKFKKTGHRVLMFFQMTQIMDIMEDFLRFRNMKYLRLDGGTKADERTDLLTQFNAPDSEYFAFLLSTRAGGLGLNLQTADTVIIYDTDWNPHQDLQAQDRAHRIGQTKEVRILRLITEGSIEENILGKAHAKLEIDGKVIQAGKFDNKSTSEEQEAFLRSLLEAEEAKRGQKGEEDEDLDDEELNEILARTDEERELFRSYDQERLVTDKWKGKRLMTMEELPDVYKRETRELLKKEPIENYGRGARERKIMHYDDGLTEEQWLEAVDNDEDSIEDAIARKRARQAKRNKKNGSESPVPVAAPPPAAMSPAGASTTPDSLKKKRGRKPRDSVDEVPVMPPRKKAKGRPPKIKETLSPQERYDLTMKMRGIFDHVYAVHDDELNRNRIELFTELPSKKLYPDYYMLIKTPVACDGIEKRMNNNTYQNIESFLNDFQTMFKNARIYNEEGSIVYEDANKLERAMKDKLKELDPEKFEALFGDDDDNDDDDDDDNDGHHGENQNGKGGVDTENGDIKESENGEDDSLLSESRINPAEDSLIGDIPPGSLGMKSLGDFGDSFADDNKNDNDNDNGNDDDNNNNNTTINENELQPNKNDDILNDF